MSVDAFFCGKLATVLNIYLGLCFSELKEMKSNQILPFLMLFCRRRYFPAMQLKIPLVLFSPSCAPFSMLLSLGREYAHYITVSDSFPLSSLKEQPYLKC